MEVQCRGTYHGGCRCEQCAAAHDARVCETCTPPQACPVCGRSGVGATHDPVCLDVATTERQTRG